MFGQGKRNGGGGNVISDNRRLPGAEKKTLGKPQSESVKTRTRHLPNIACANLHNIASHDNLYIAIAHAPLLSLILTVTRHRTQAIRYHGVHVIFW